MTKTKNRIKAAFVHALMALLAFTSTAQVVQAAMVGTEEAHAAGASSQARSLIDATLAKPEVLSRLQQLGVNPEDAQARVAALSDDEAVALAERIDSLPAGADSVLGVVVFLFLLLLVTDWLGLTKIFPFTRAQR